MQSERASASSAAASSSSGTSAQAVPSKQVCCLSPCCTRLVLGVRVCVCACVHACVRQPLFHVQDQLGRTVQLCFVCLNSHVLLYCPLEATGTQTGWLLCLAITSSVLAGLRHLRDQQFEQQHTDLNTLCVCCSTRPSLFLMPYLLEPVCFLPSCGPREENTVAYN